MAPQVDAAIATNAALKRNNLEIAGMRSSFSLTNLPGRVTYCLNDVPVKGLDESAATNLQVDNCVRRDAPFRTRLGKSGQRSILVLNCKAVFDPKRTLEECNGRRRACFGEVNLAQEGAAR
jgi:hypothetical protein